METTPYLFYKFFDENKKRRSRFKMNRVVLCVAKVEHAQMIGNDCTRSHGGGVVFGEKNSGVVFGWSRCVWFLIMKHGVWPTLAVCEYFQSPCSSTVNGMRYPMRRACVVCVCVCVFF